VDNELYSYSPIVEREPMTFPGGARVAFYVGLNIEHFRVGVPGTSIQPSNNAFVPDPLNHGWRDYGPRVGIWRMIDLFDETGIRPSAIINSDACLAYPKIISAGVERGWDWVAHGQTNSVLEVGMSEDDEAAYLDGMLETLDDALPARPTGWLGPALTETFATPRLLRERNFRYLLDWCCDDRPFALNIPGLISVPYSLEINDIGLFVGKNTTGSAYEEIVVSQLEQLLDEGGGVMALPVHPFVVGQPFRFKFLARILRRIAATEGVWITTSTDIANLFLGEQAASATTAARA
jgi:hypothetical protein